jgi:hypothetical protein
MSASVEEAANAHSHLSPKTPNSKITPAKGYGTMKAGSWDPVGIDTASFSAKLIYILVAGAEEGHYQGCARTRTGTEPVSRKDGLRVPVPFGYYGRGSWPNGKHDL